MTDRTSLEVFLAGARIDPAVTTLRPDCRAHLIAVDGIAPVQGDDATEAVLARAEAAASDLLANSPAEEVPHVAAWREAYRAFGAKPQRTRNSLEALLRRASTGLPRINGLTDIYNAISVIHQVPLGGEDLDRYAGPPRLIRATGSEAFDTVADGAGVIEHPEPGEVVWCDGQGVTCRRWNWRQGRRTQLSPDTTSALFILDALAPMPDGALAAAGDDLTGHLRRIGPDVRVTTRVLTPPQSEHPGAPVICCQFIFKPGTYDDDFHRLDQEIDEYARSLPGFDKVEKWVAPEGDVVNAIYYFADRESVAQLGRFPQHREAKGQVQRWYDGYRIVISDIRATYGDGRLPA